MFAEADFNEDGRVDYEEFLTWLSGRAPTAVDAFAFPAFEPTDYNCTGQLEKSAWARKMNEKFEQLGKQAFLEWVDKQSHALSRELGKQGATILLKGLPDPLDGLQRHALEFVESMWGKESVYRTYCQEYGLRTHARIVHVSGTKEYTPPSTGHMQTFHGGKVCVERAVKIATANPKPDLKTWDIAYHGIDTHARDGWSKSGPRFTGYGGAHGPGIYTTPSFSLAGVYALRRWTKEWRYDDVPSRYLREGEEMHFIAILMCALEPGKFKKCSNTCDGVSATTEGWGSDSTEWVVPGENGKEVPEVQIYGVNFCYFRDNPRA
ncbi:unnamed protein product [Polarella glacialis]|uniref:EF-hand domain-containing protein n=1 Tax=Polarella glacialis TaxID=89957 RepID=A0A813G7U6_POLGL|nr:unnamed protein product [Polarella glacialis]